MLLAGGLGVGFADEKPSLSLLDDPGAFSFDTEDLSLSDPAPELATSTAWLGLGLQEMDVLEQAVAGKGIRVHAVAPNAAAQKAGLVKGDVLTHWNGEPVKTVLAYAQRLLALTVAEKVTLTVRRKQVVKRFTLEATDRDAYPWKEFWEPDLPDFKAAEDLGALFEEQEATLDSLTATLDALLEEDAEQAKPAAADEPACVDDETVDP